MPVTLADAQAKLAYWMAADDACSKGQKFSWNGRSIELPSAETIRSQIIYWERREVALSRGSGQGHATASFL